MRQEISTPLRYGGHYKCLRPESSRLQIPRRTEAVRRRPRCCRPRQHGCGYRRAPQVASSDEEGLAADAYCSEVGSPASISNILRSNLGRAMMWRCPRGAFPRSWMSPASGNQDQSWMCGKCVASVFPAYLGAPRVNPWERRVCLASAVSRALDYDTRESRSLRRRVSQKARALSCTEESSFLLGPSPASANLESRQRGRHISRASLGRASHSSRPKNCSSGMSCFNLTHGERVSDQNTFARTLRTNHCEYLDFSRSHDPAPRTLRAKIKEPNLYTYQAAGSAPVNGAALNRKPQLYKRAHALRDRMGSRSSK